jgi:tagatose 6-phosphate kinase
MPESDQQSVLTVTLNPAVDKSLFCRGAITGDNVRARRMVDLAGGKGVNVARGLKALGVEARALAVLGGFPGRYVEHLMAEEGLAGMTVPIADTTRHAITLLEEETGEYLHVLEPGPDVTDTEVDALREAYERALVGARLVLISGSVPQASLAWLPAELVLRARHAKVEVWLDASGDSLLRGVTAKPSLVKPNRAEVEVLVGRPCRTQEEAVAAVREVAALGVPRVVLSLGEQGIVAWWEGETLRATAPPAAERCAIGSGDALVAGMAAARLAGESAADVLRWGAACGAANAETWLPTQFTREAAQSWLPQVRVERVA